MRSTAQPSPVANDHLALQRLYHWEANAPHQVVLVQPTGQGRITELTWSQAMDQVRRVAAWLKAQGIQPGDRVALLSKNTTWWLLADWAIWLAGGVSVPLYPTLAADTVRQVLQHSGSRWLFVGKLDDWPAMRAGVPEGLPCVALPLAPPTPYPAWDHIVATTAPLQGQPLRDAQELSTIMYTSGTTGVPKGVMHSFGTFAWSTQAALRRIPLDAKARMLSYLPLSHVAERTLVEHCLVHTGMKVYFAESLDTFAADLRRARPTVFFSVPRLWVKFQQGVLAKMPQARLERLLALPLVGTLVRRKILKALGLDACVYPAGGAAPMPPALLRWYAALGLPIIEAYGMTENCGVSHSTLPGQQRPGSVGPAVQGVQARLDPATGEVQVKSAGLMLGYYRAPALTEEAFTDDGWLHTGDKGQLDGDGWLRITGRVKDLFKTSKGKYVAPAPIEDRLVMHHALEACCVTGANLGQPLAVAMLNAEAAARADSAEGREALQASLARHLSEVNATLDPHEQLACLALSTQPWTVGNGFITPTFKVRRNRVEEVYAERYGQWESMRQPVIWV